MAACKTWLNGLKRGPAALPGAIWALALTAGPRRQEFDHGMAGLTPRAIPPRVQDSGGLDERRRAQRLANRDIGDEQVFNSDG